MAWPKPWKRLETSVRRRAASALNRLWFRFGLLFGKMTTPIVMEVLFYVTVTPVAFLMRLMKKDPLRLKRDVSASTYWLPRRPLGPERGSMREQF